MTALGLAMWGGGWQGCCTCSLRRARSSESVPALSGSHPPFPPDTLQIPSTHVGPACHPQVQVTLRSDTKVHGLVLEKSKVQQDPERLRPGVVWGSCTLGRLTKVQLG